MQNDNQESRDALEEAIRQCAQLVDHADGLLITSGAGMGVDAGLPDFRGPQGFWGVYPALAHAGKHFEDIANPASFRADPRLAWGFYGHRLQLYRRTQPHEGYRILWRWAQEKPHGAFVYTSNVDGLFQKAGFREERITECHGSIHHLQCTKACTEAIWEADPFSPEIDETRCRLTSDLPLCLFCRAVARPNILMFDDWGWLTERTRQQRERLREWMGKVTSPLVVEVGAGTRISTVRQFGGSTRWPLIRINPDEDSVGNRPGVGLALGALDALVAIDQARKAR